MSSSDSRLSLFRVMGSMLALTLLVVAAATRSCNCIQLNVGIDHDLSGPTYGLEGKTSSAVHYDDRTGLNLKGTINDLLGPPIKIANGFQNIFKGHNVAGLGAGLKTGGAMLGFDAAMLEAAGAGNLLKGGLLLNGANAKTNLAGQLAGTKGQKIANIIEVPVKVVAMKDIAEGNILNGIGQLKQTGAQAVSSKGQQLMNQGQNMKTQGLNQIVTGAQEGIKNIGNMVQKTTEDFNTAFKLLPMVWDMQQQQQIQQQEATKGQVVQQQAQKPVSTAYQLSPSSGGNPITGGSLFGGISSLLPNLNTNVITDSPSGGNAGLGNLFGLNSAPNAGYAALLNSTSPLTSLLMNERTNPFWFPLAQGPFGQAITGLQPIGTQESQHGPLSSSSGVKGAQRPQTEVYDFNLFPGLRYKETFSSQLPTFGLRQQQSKTSSASGEAGVKSYQSTKGQQEAAPAVKSAQQVVEQHQQQADQVKTKN